MWDDVLDESEVLLVRVARCLVVVAVGDGAAADVGRRPSDAS